MKKLLKIMLALVLGLSLAPAITSADSDISIDSILSFDDVKGAISKLDVRSGVGHFPDIQDGKTVFTTSATLFGLSYKDTEYLTIGGGYFGPSGVFAAVGTHVRPVIDKIPYVRVTNSIFDALPGDPDLQAQLLYGRQLKDGGETGVGYGLSVSVDF